MQLVEFPGCCAAKVLVGFGQSNTAAWGFRPDREYTEESFFGEALHHLAHAGRYNYATVIAITNSDQTTAISVLPKLGFVCVQQDLGKNQHADKTISTWVYTVTGADRQPLPLPVNPFAKKAEDVKKVDEVVAAGVGGFHPAVRTPLYQEMRQYFLPRIGRVEWRKIADNLKQVYDDENVRASFGGTSLFMAFHWASAEQGDNYWRKLNARMAAGRR